MVMKTDKILRYVGCCLLLFLLIPSLGAMEQRNRRSGEATTLPANGGSRPPILHRQAHPTVYSVLPEDSKLVEHYIHYFSRGEGRAYFIRCLNRSRMFEHHIRTRIQESELPPELFYLPLVESAFRNEAYSRSGASGLWQFMLNSIGPYPIRVNSWMDERRDFWKSTEAALHKLAFNYSRLRDWPLALAAYNCGLGRVERTVASSGISNFWELSKKGLLPLQTIHYVPRIMAAAALASDLRRYDLPVNWEAPQEWIRIEIEHQVSLDLLAKEADIDPELLALGNAELFYGVSPPPDQHHALKIPAESADNVRRVLESKEQSSLMRYTVHRIAPGDTLYDLSRHFGVTVSMIESCNPGIRAQYLRSGRELIIPYIRDVGPYRSRSEEDQRPFNGSHTVAAGETLWAIAQSYGTSPETLARKNRISVNDTIFPGIRLKVPDQREVQAD